jgi:hypothetical protein
VFPWESIWPGVEAQREKGYLYNQIVQKRLYWADGQRWTRDSFIVSWRVKGNRVEEGQRLYSDLFILGVGSTPPQGPNKVGGWLSLFPEGQRTLRPFFSTLFSSRRQSRERAWRSNSLERGISESFEPCFRPLRSKYFTLLWNEETNSLWIYIKYNGAATYIKMLVILICRKYTKLNLMS